MRVCTVCRGYLALVFDHIASSVYRKCQTCGYHEDA